MELGLSFSWKPRWFTSISDSVCQKLNSMTCTELYKMSDENLNYFTEVLISAPNNEQQDKSSLTLLKIVECLDSERIKNHYWPQFGKRILIKVRGEAGQRLRACMQDFFDNQNNKGNSDSTFRDDEAANISYELEQQRKIIEAKDRLVRNKVRNKRQHYVTSEEQTESLNTATI